MRYRGVVGGRNGLVLVFVRAQGDASDPHMKFMTMMKKGCGRFLHSAANG